VVAQGYVLRGWDITVELLISVRPLHEIMNMLCLKVLVEVLERLDDQIQHQDILLKVWLKRA
jgi:hypothetical protein